MTRRVVLSAVWIALLGGCAYAGPRGPWLAPDFGGREPQYENRALFWHQNMPNEVYVYRAEVQVPADTMYVGAQAKANGHLYIIVDGREVFCEPPEWREGRPFPGGMWTVDLTDALRPGRHTVVVGAPRSGFALAGLMIPPTGEPRPLVADASWRAWRLPPTTIIERDPCAGPGFNAGQWAPVTADEANGIEANLDEIVKACWQGETARLSELVDEADWRLNLLARKGIGVADWETCGPGRPEWADPLAVTMAGLASMAIWDLRKNVAAMRTWELDTERYVSGPAGYRYRERRQTIELLNRAAEGLGRIVKLSDELQNAKNWAAAFEALDVKVNLRPDIQRLERGLTRLKTLQPSLEQVEEVFSGLAEVEGVATQLRDKAEKAWGHPLNRLNESRFSKLGWMPNPDLVDGELGDWGIRVAPAEAPNAISLDGNWRFSTDQDNQGLQAGWQTVGFNIENQWRQVRVPGTWESQNVTDENPNAAAQNPYPQASVNAGEPYNGFAWYRTRFQVPDAWRGQDLDLLIERADDWDWCYLNDQPIGRTGAETPDAANAARHYVVPKGLVKFGDENVLAIRIYDAGGAGGLGHVEVRCPGFQAVVGDAPSSRVYRSYLTPAILLQAEGLEMAMWGWDERGAPGPAAIQLNLGGKPTARPLNAAGTVYDRARDGKLSANWLLLTFASADDLPVLLVLEKNPSAMDVATGAKGVSRLTLGFEAEGARAVAVRAFRNGAAPSPQACGFLSRALLEYPFAYTELTRRDPQDADRIVTTTIYNYVSLKDEWGTQPIRLAPLPMMASYAAKCNLPGLRIEGGVPARIAALNDFGDWRAAEGTDRVTYSYPRDRVLRLGGFTSWMFVPGDSGVPGNDRECELIAETGANSFRPQHNFTGEKVQILADYCRKYGLNYMGNVDNTFAPDTQKAVDHWTGIARLLKDRPPYAVAYDLINEAANMKAGPYNALIGALTRAVREVGDAHLLYVEPCESWGAVEKMPLLQVTGDPRTVYSFHDYNFRLHGQDRWPTLERDIGAIYRQWLPALQFMIEHNVPIHIGEFGGYDEGAQFRPDAMTMLADKFRIFDQYNMHFHYYANRMNVKIRQDGSLQEATVAEAHRRYFGRGQFNQYFGEQERRIWP